MGPCVRRDDDRECEVNDVHCRQTGAATAASSEVARVRPARTVPDDRVRRIVFRILALGHGRYRHADPRQSMAMAAGGHLDAVRLCHLHRHRGRHAPQRSSLSDGGLRGDARHAAADRRNHYPPRGADGGGGPDLLRLHQLSQGLWQFPAAVEHADRLALCRDPAVRRPDRAVHVEQLVNGIRNGFDHPEPPLEDAGDIPPADTSFQNRGQP